MIRRVCNNIFIRFIALIGGIIGVICIVLWICDNEIIFPKNNDESTRIIIEEENTSSKDGVKYIERESYLHETIYDGTKDITSELFATPFRKSDKYISNKNLIDTLDEETINNILDTANAVIMSLFDNGYRTIIKNQDSFKETISNLLVTNSLMVNGEPIDTEQYINGLVEWYIDNKVKMVAELDTDKSLIWQDEFIYLRGDLNITIYNCENADTMENFFGFSDIEIGEPVHFICEVQYFPKGDFKEIANLLIQKCE